MQYIVPGFRAAAVAAGLKKDGALDLALIYSEREATAAGVFTTNLVKAAPVLLSRKNLQHGKGRAIIVNAGNANACTGARGMSDAIRTTQLVANGLEIPMEHVYAASTGVIGEPLNMVLVENAIPKLIEALSSEGIPSVAQAIMTTDSFRKISQFEGKAAGRPYRMLGIAKGAGMIMPNMATMLCFVMSDIGIDQHNLGRILKASVEATLNRVTVDGDTSTNDMVLMLGNGVAGNVTLSQEDLIAFEDGLKGVLGELAQMIVRDGEGATKMIHVEVEGASSASDALKAARTVANSPLVKTAFYGSDPNWGRIMAALGRADITMEQDKVDLWFDDVQVVAGGLSRGVEAEKLAAERMGQKECRLRICLNLGNRRDRVLTCDLTHDYVSINAHYRT